MNSNLFIMMRPALQAVTGLAIIRRGFWNQTVTGVLQRHCKRLQWNCPSAFQNVRPLTMALWPFSAQPRDYSQPNESWSPEMQKVYDEYMTLCEVENEDGKTERGHWQKLPSYNRSLKYVKGGVYLSKIMQAKARLFTRSIKEHGAAFEYVVFMNKEEKRCVCVFQSGHLLEGPPGRVHGGAIATMIDSVTGTLAGTLFGPVMTANLNINYRRPIPLGSVILIHSALDRVEGRKTFLTCRVTSLDESTVHTEATALFLSINMGHLFGTKT